MATPIYYTDNKVASPYQFAGCSGLTAGWEQRSK